ncbi:MAG: sugar phosphate nucleotidyltransferase [Desulfobacula sp.]|jgi:NDP-sugar pyrophosphorylase family protein|nr:sugar phosphate nucleotidyltransferase [Desulfobacula sp.]
MKALILAAGLGTRLLPYTKTIPKPLFTINLRPVLDIAIEKLVHCGCKKIFINTHHCHEQIEAFVEQHPYRSMIQTIYEPLILDTGGTIASLRQFLDKSPFFVINADIVSDIDLNKVYEFHLTSNSIATLVLHDYPEFNKIKTDENGFIENFNTFSNKGSAFTGIQVLSPDIYSHMPKQKVFSSIDVYKALCPDKKVKAYMSRQIFWKDIGSIQSYQETSRQCLCANIFGLPENKIHEIQIIPLAGDGSDRQWFRAGHGKKTLVISDHGICPDPSENLSQLEAFVKIGNHLSTKQIFVPKILGHDKLSGQVALEDLGDVHLASIANQYRDNTNKADLLILYKNVIDRLIEFSQNGIQNFNTDWTCQTPSYSKELILEKECAYFMAAFVRDYLDRDVIFETLSDEFTYIADNALEFAYNGLMHRDMQSKNIMIKEKNIYFIDFQSARTGPLQYDLASLLIDPYVRLPDNMKKELLLFTMSRLGIESNQGKKEFKECYQFCCLTRNLQFLGAFAYLSLIKGKKGFESHIPNALFSLKSMLQGMESLPKLNKLVKSL